MMNNNKEDSVEHSNYLAAKNAHIRDEYIRFFEIGHRYQITFPDDKKTGKYTSVTTWNHSHFPKFDSDAIIAGMMRGKKWNSDNKYWGMNAEQIKESWNKNGQNVAAAGTEMHFQIECFMNLQMDTNENPTHLDLFEYYSTLKDGPNPSAKSDEWGFFIQFIKDHPKMRPYRTEWTVFDETVRIAGSIDMVYENPDGTLSIYDWKRCKDITPENNWNKFALHPVLEHIPDTNFWHYTLQLNTYKKILENNYGVRIRELVLVRLHPDNPDKTYELIEVPILSREMEELFRQRHQEMK